MHVLDEVPVPHTDEPSFGAAAVVDEESLDASYTLVPVATDGLYGHPPPGKPEITLSWD